MELIKVASESGKATLKISRVYKHSELTHAHGHIPVNHTLRRGDCKPSVHLHCQSEAPPFSQVFLFLRHGKL